MKLLRALLCCLFHFVVLTEDQTYFAFDIAYLVRLTDIAHSRGFETTEYHWMHRQRRSEVNDVHVSLPHTINQLVNLVGSSVFYEPQYKLSPLYACSLVSQECAGRSR